MELGQLRAMLALAELSSFSRAAERLHLSTPAVFNQVRQLEDEVGDRLYERVGRRLQLTRKGKLLAEHSNRILAAYDRALSDLTGGSGADREVLRLGSGPHSGIRVVPFLLRAFLEANPEVEIRFSGGDDQSLLRDLRGGALDAVLLSLPVGDPALREQPLWNYEMVFVLPPRRFREWHPEEGIPALADKPFILFRRPVVVDRAIEKLFAGTGCSPRVVMENDDPASITELVKLGLGFSVLPLWSVGDDWKRDEVAILRGPESSFHEYGLLCRSSSYAAAPLIELRRVASAWREWWPLAQFVSPVAGA